MNITQKIIQKHLVNGSLEADSTIAIKVDQVLTQDATGTLVYLQFETLGLDRIKTPLAVSYVDHNTLQSTPLNADDHAYLKSVTGRFGAYFSRPGNGICHQVHLERFGAPGQTLLGSDSHTPTGGGIGMLAIGVGGLDVACAMAGEAFELAMPQVVGVKLTGDLRRPWVSAMDIILEILRQKTVKGGVGKVFEYFGPGVANLGVPERATITNMGAELGATSSVFPSDERTHQFLKAQGRENAWVELAADADATYDEVIEIDLSTLEPLIAQPSSPDNIVPVKTLAGKKVQQVCVGSCTNSSYQAIKTVACLLKGKTIHPDTSMTLSPGSKQVVEMLSASGDIEHIAASGVRILESACGPCIGMGQAPATGAISIRSFNRNFKGRSGNPEDQTFLASPIVGTLAALNGELIDPLSTPLPCSWADEPDTFQVNDNMLIVPVDESIAKKITIIRGPNIKPVPTKESLPDMLELPVLLKTGDNISTDDILPGGSKILPLRSNIPAISEYVYSRLDADYVNRAKTSGAHIIIGGNNYGQGSSREHAALAPMALELRAVIAKSFARIHKANLVNYGVLPLELKNPDDYDALSQGDILRIENLIATITSGELTFTAINTSQNNTSIPLTAELSDRQRQMLLAGGLLPYIKNNTDQRR